MDPAGGPELGVQLCNHNLSLIPRNTKYYQVVELPITKQSGYPMTRRDMLRTGC